MLWTTVTKGTTRPEKKNILLRTTVTENTVGAYDFPATPLSRPSVVGIASHSTAKSLGQPRCPQTTRIPTRGTHFTLKV